MITKIELQQALNTAFISDEELLFRVDGYKATFRFFQHAYESGSIGRSLYMVEDNFTTEVRIGNAEIKANGVQWFMYHPMGKKITGTIYYSKITVCELPVTINQPLQTV
jgi:hypothetical protein